MTHWKIKTRPELNVANKDGKKHVICGLRHISSR